MKQEDYISERLQNQIDWYDKKSLQNQKRFKTLRKVEIVVAAFIPFLSGIAASIDEFNFVFFIIIGMLGIIITIIASLISLSKYQENWTEYRTICETLKKEKYLYQVGINPYHKDDGFLILVERVESIISKENTNWANYVSKIEETVKA